jgi:hypothetical protein
MFGTITATHAPIEDAARRASTKVVIAAASIPVMVIGQFAMLAIVPVVVVVRTTWRHPHLRPLRPWAVGLATLYAVPLVLWAVGPDRERSLSKDMDAPFAALIVAGAIGFLIRLGVGRAVASDRSEG